jgi:DNA-binding MarR family transcriptional regulator
MTERGRSKSSSKKENGKGSKPYVMECQVGFLMRIAMQRHTSIFMSLMPHNLTQTQFAVVAKLAEVGTTSQNQLGRLVCLDAATTKGVVDRLGARKIVMIETNPRDRRHCMVALTKRGTRIAQHSVNRAHQITAKTLAPLNRNDQRAIIRLLRKMS